MIKGIWYRPQEACLFGRIANPASQPTEVANMKAHFAQFVADGFNAIFVTLPDEDGYQGAYGGGFPYDPMNHPRPDMAAAFELLITLADAAGLKVVANISLSQYHTFIDDTFGNPSGAYDFIHAIIGPEAYYPGAKSFIGDTRIAGWLFAAETVLAAGEADIVARCKFIMDKYFSFVQLVAHWGGATSSWVGSYALAGPDAVLATAVARIAALAAYKPERLCFEGYTTGMPTGSTYMALNQLFQSVKAAAPSIPPANWILGECGNADTEGPARHESIAEVVECCSDFGIGGFGVWVCNGLGDQPGKLQADPTQQGFALYDSIFTSAGILQLASPPQGWHWFNPPTGMVEPYTNPKAFQLENNGTPPWPAGYGEIGLTANAYGRSVIAAIQET